MLAYLDCFSGISGDMTLGAFIDIGVPIEFLTESIAALNLEGVTISAKPLFKNRIKGINFKVCEDNKHHHSRDYAEIISLIEKSSIKSKVKDMSLLIFDKIAEAESHIHGVSKDNVHFHEIGSVDSIVDIVGVSLCLDYLNITKVISSKIPISTGGFVSCQHGQLPIPAPATLFILRDVPVYGVNIPFELVTPTGAAIVKTLAASFENIPPMIIRKFGYGAGTRDLTELPNLLRIILGDIDSYQDCENVLLIETCIDDMNPEIFGYLMDRLFEDGALDVYLIPIFMKKNRPGTLLKVLSPLYLKDKITNRIFLETTTIGVRYHNIYRNKLNRKNVTAKTRYGHINVKQIQEIDGSIRLVPEYEECKRIALENNIPLKIVYGNINNDI
ncbi:MAG: nickel pincer cofactor biosynthesis protein LarC [Desulfobacterales bacterium]|nr:nickel pincer cofactor biosynthesis protein LarC [Desulfobacterales bacterium]MBF0397132.1 nickel pincer cofactor biosynthesis protein LarC [Desulfobacterales bacterium]